MSSAPTSVLHLGFQAWVECEGTALPVYGVELSGNKATCWIASQAGKNFSVHFKQLDRSKRKTVVGRVHVDGSYVGGKVFGTVPPHDSDSHTVERMRIGATVARKLQFSALPLCDNDSATNDHALLSSLGYISVKFNYCVVAGRHAHTGLKAPGSFQTGEFKVDEKAKKLGGHHATLGAPEAVQATTRLNVRDVKGEHLVIFEFKYRPTDVLQAQDIIHVERQTTPVPRKEAKKRQREPSITAQTTKKPKILEAEHREDDPEALRARIRELEARLQVKADPDFSSSVKMEAIHASRFFTQGQVIDLTDE